MDLVKDLYNNNKLYRLSMDPSGIDISGENQILRINSDKITGNLNVDGDLSLNGDLSMNGDVFIDGDLSMNGDIDITGSLDITGDINIINTSAVKITNGSTGQRPITSEVGQIRYNNDIDHYEGYRKISEILSHWEQFILPAGAIQHFAMQTAPSGWLICDGSNVLQTDYPKLYAAIGNIYGTPSGDNAANEFLLPDFRGRFIRGWDDMGQGSAGNDLSANRVFGSVQEDDNKEHNHDITDPGHYHGTQAGNWGGRTYATTALAQDGANKPGYNTYSATTGITINHQGTESRPKNIALLVCIKY